jgi:hypothetical protein
VHLFRKEDVGGSTPSTGSNPTWCVRSGARTPDCQSGGDEFESRTHRPSGHGAAVSVLGLEPSGREFESLCPDRTRERSGRMRGPSRKRLGRYDVLEVRVLPLPPGARPVPLTNKLARVAQQVERLSEKQEGTGVWRGGRIRVRGTKYRRRPSPCQGRRSMVNGRSHVCEFQSCRFHMPRQWRYVVSSYPLPQGRKAVRVESGSHPRAKARQHPGAPLDRHSFLWET